MRPIKISAGDRPLQPASKTKRKIHKNKQNKTQGKETFARRRVKSKSGVSLVLGGFVKLCKMIVGIFAVIYSFASQKSQNKSPKTTSRRKPPKFWPRVTIFGGAFTALSLLVGVAGYNAVQNGVVERAGLWVQDARLSVLASAGMVVQEVSVVGRARTPANLLMAALEVSRGDSIVDFDPDLARMRIEKLGWVEHASVMRRFPDEIFIRLQERRPFARWQNKQKTVVIDRKGAVISKIDHVEFRHLPKVVGLGANERAAELFDLLAKTPALFTRLQNAVRVRDRRWNLEFGNGVKVLLPEEGSAEAWARLNKLQQDQKILNKGILAIDLRTSDKMYVRLRPADAAFRRDADTKT